MAKAGTKTKSTNKPPHKPAGVPVAATRAAETIENDIAEVMAKLEKTSFYDDKYDRLAETRRALLTELELSQLKEMPTPEMMGMPVEGTERVDLEDIVLNGNHREGDRGLPPASDPALIRLSRSMRMGLIHPIGLVNTSKDQPKYRLIYGTRRYLAAKLLDWTGIEAKVYPADISEDQIELLRTVENFDRADLTPVEKAIAVARMIDAVNRAMADPDDEMTLARQVASAGGPLAYVAMMLGRPLAWVQDHAYVQRLGGQARKLLSERRLNVEHARELAKLGDPEAADLLAEDVARNESGLGGKDLTYLRQRIQEHTKSLKTVPWRLDVEFGKSEKTGCMGWACNACPHNSKSDPVLFGDGPLMVGGMTTVAAPDVATNPDMDPELIDGDDRKNAGACMNGPCFAGKMKKSEELIAAAIAKARKAIKKDKLAVTATALAHVIPMQIRPSSFISQARKVIEPETGKATPEAAERTDSGAKKTRSDGSPAVKLTPEQKARNDYFDELEKWKMAAGLKVAGAVAKNPATHAMYIILRAVSFFEAMNDRGRGYDNASSKANEVANAKAEKIAGQSATLSILKKLAKPTLADIVAQAKNIRSPEKWEVSRLVPGALLAMGEALGVKLTDPPEPAEPEKTVEKSIEKSKAKAGK